MMRSTAFVAAILFTPNAIASGSLEAGPATVEVDNGIEEDCVDPSGLCLAALHNESVGSAEIDLRERYRFVGITINDSQPNEALGIEPLPDRSFLVDTSAFKIPWPVFRILHERIGTVERSTPVGEVGVVFDSEGNGARFPAPSVLPGEEPNFHEEGVQSDYAEEGTDGFSYETFDPTNDFHNTSTDKRVEEVFELSCRLENASEVAGCKARARAQAAALAERTPNLVIGLAFDELGAATEPNAFNDSVTGGSRASALAPIGARTAAAAPSLPRGDAPVPGVLHVYGGSAIGTPDPSAPSRTPVSLLRTASLVPQPNEPKAPSYVVPIAAAFAIAVAAAALYSRVVRDKRLLFSEPRVRLLKVLSERGPMPKQEVGRELGLEPSTLLYHARVLVKSGQLHFHRADRRIYLALPGQQLPRIRPRMAGRPACKLILEVLEASGGGIERQQLWERLPDLPARRRNEALRACVNEGVIEQVWTSEGQIVRLRAPQGAAP